MKEFRYFTVFLFGIEILYSRDQIPHPFHQTHIQVREGTGYFVYGKMFPKGQQYGTAQLATQSSFAIIDEKT